MRLGKEQVSAVVGDLVGARSSVAVRIPVGHDGDPIGVAAAARIVGRFFVAAAVHLTGVDLVNAVRDGLHRIVVGATGLGVAGRQAEEGHGAEEREDGLHVVGWLDR